MLSILRLFDSNEKDIKRFQRVVNRINALEPDIKSLDDATLFARTDVFRDRLAKGETLDDILPEAFAVCREASLRVLKMRHFDVQLIGGMVLHDGRIAEMKTGEGKTLVATLPIYLNALEGRGVHLVTANDYLARRDAVWMAPLYHALGMSVGVIQGQSAETGETGGSFVYEPGYEPKDVRYTHLREVHRRQAYACDILYGTNNEFGFDYLRDNMEMRFPEIVQRELNFAIVDEVDSILIDEARTPLIISGPAGESTDLYYRVERVVRHLEPETHYKVDEKQKLVTLTEDGVGRCEQGLGVPNLSENPDLMHHVTAALKSHALFKRDVDYVVKDGEIIIVDEFTGRLMFGRRYSDGLHQAIEAKEGVQIRQENQTLATITFQNYFRLYRKLAGMTGTAKTEEDEFRKIYALDVVVAPTNKPVKRIDWPDVMFKTEEAKMRGITQDILRLFCRRQPVLVGTRSIEMSEKVSDRLRADRLKVLSLILVCRDRLDQNKQLSNDRKKEMRQQLNRPIPDLNISALTPIARELGVVPDMNLPENLQEIARLIDAPDAQETVREALQHGVSHSILNAKFHEQEALIISEAGSLGAVTIATNMAGRGVDILLGGNVLPPDAVRELSAEDAEAEEERRESFRRGRALPPPPSTEQERSRIADEVRKVGGLYVLGTERHESRRIDNQLRGRSGRQGDPGESRFYVSFEDELWRRFGDRTNSPFMRMWEEDQSVDVKMLSRMIERAQKKVESYNFEIRKNVLEYDEVMNEQRRTIYAERRRILEGHPLQPTIEGFIGDIVDFAVGQCTTQDGRNVEVDYEGLMRRMDEVFVASRFVKPGELEQVPPAELASWLTERMIDGYAQRRAEGWWLFNVGDFVDPVRLAQELRNPERPFCALLRDHLSAITRQLLDAWKPARLSVGLDETLHTLLYQDFNAVLQSDLFAVENLPSLVELTEETAAMRDEVLAAGEATQARVLHLNRMVLNDAFPDILARSNAVERWCMLRVVNDRWMEHLANMDHLRDGIGLRGYGQKDPLVEYKKEAFEMFQSMMASLQDEVVNWIFHIQIAPVEEERPAPAAESRPEASQENRQSAAATPRSGPIPGQSGAARTGLKVGRNDPCPCGSGKKYKKCCMDKLEGA